MHSFGGPPPPGACHLAGKFVRRAPRGGPSWCTTHQYYGDLDTVEPSAAGLAGGPSGAITRIADEVAARLDVLVDEIVAAVEREVPFYRHASPQARQVFRAMSSAEVSGSLERIRAGSRLLPLAARETYRTQGERFAEQGIPLSDLTRTFEVATRVIVPAVIDIAMRLGPEGMTALGHYLRLAMDQLTTAVSLVSRGYLDRESELVAQRRRSRDGLVADLLGGVDWDRIAARASALGFPRADEYAVIVAPLPTADVQRELVEIERSVARSMTQEWWVVIGHVIAVVVPTQRRSSEPVAHVANALGHALASVIEERPLVACGPVHAGLPGIRASFQEATQIANAARAAGLRGAVEAHDVSVHRLLVAAPDVGRELRDLIAPLLAHDQEQGSGLIEVLSVYIDANLSAVDAADALGVHRNTLRYRLDLIERLLGANIKDLRLQLRLALIAHDLERLRTAADV